MKHAREDYNRIQDPEGKIGEDEPVFLLRAKDISAPDVVLAWATEQLKYPNADMRLVELAHKHVKAMRDWQNKNGTKVADL